jgi:hypothetical protein
VIVLSLGVLSGSFNGYSSGIRTSRDPYQAASAQDLIAPGGTTDDYGSHFVPTVHIDLPGYLFDQVPTAPDAGDSNHDFRRECSTDYCVPEGDDMTWIDDVCFLLQ